MNATRKELEAALSELGKVYEGLAENVREGTGIEEIVHRQGDVLVIAIDVIRQTVTMMAKSKEVAA
jgi:hypothetical protein